MDFIHSPPTPDSSQPHIADEVREEIISRYYDLMVAAETVEAASFWWQRMREQIGRRSAERIEQMEIERGLR